MAKPLPPIPNHVRHLLYEWLGGASDTSVLTGKNAGKVAEFYASTDLPQWNAPIYRGMQLPFKHFERLMEQGSLSLQYRTAESWAMRPSASLRFMRPNADVFGSNRVTVGLLLSQPKPRPDSLIVNAPEFYLAYAKSEHDIAYMGKDAGYIEYMRRAFTGEMELILRQQCLKCDLNDVEIVLLDMHRYSPSHTPEYHELVRHGYDDWSDEGYWKSTKSLDYRFNAFRVSRDGRLARVHTIENTIWPPVEADRAKFDQLPWRNRPRTTIVSSAERPRQVFAEETAKLVDWDFLDTPAQKRDAVYPGEPYRGFNPAAQNLVRRNNVKLARLLSRVPTRFRVYFFVGNVNRLVQLDSHSDRGIVPYRKLRDIVGAALPPADPKTVSFILLGDGNRWRGPLSKSYSSFDPPTPWIVIHWMCHAMLGWDPVPSKATGGSAVMPQGLKWRRRLAQQLADALVEAYDHSGDDWEWTEDLVRNETALKLRMQRLFPFKAARDKRIVDALEGWLDLFVQALIGGGRIKLRVPKELLPIVSGWEYRETSDYGTLPLKPGGEKALQAWADRTAKWFLGVAKDSTGKWFVL